MKQLMLGNAAAARGLSGVAAGRAYPAGARALGADNGAAHGLSAGGAGGYLL